MISFSYLLEMSWGPLRGYSGSTFVSSGRTFAYLLEMVWGPPQEYFGSTFNILGVSPLCEACRAGLPALVRWMLDHFTMVSTSCRRTATPSATASSTRARRTPDRAGILLATTLPLVGIVPGAAPSFLAGAQPAPHRYEGRDKIRWWSMARVE